MFNKKAYQHQWYLENRERTLKKEKLKYQKNRKSIRKGVKKRRDDIKENNPKKYKKMLSYQVLYRKKNKEGISIKRKTVERKYKAYIFSAKRRNHDFTLTFEEFKVLFESSCKYCGKENANGVDRVNNQIGYLLNNCVSCCDMCNKMKWKHSEKDFLKHIKKIYNLLLV